MRKTRGFDQVAPAFEKYWGIVFPPSRADVGSAGYDFALPVDVMLDPKATVLVWTNVRAYMLPDEVLEMHIRSSLGKKGIKLANGTGIIDSSYFDTPDTGGNIGILLENTTDEPVFLERGERVAQGIFKKYLIADNDGVRNSERLGGFGSSGKGQ